MTEAPLSVFADANILVSRCLRDWFNLCASLCDEPLYVARWSDDVITEWKRAWRKRNPGVTDAALRHLLKLFFDSHGLDGEVIGFNPQDYPQPSKDIHDWHVLAAAAHANVNILLTDNKNTFTPDCVQGRFDVLTSDDFFQLVLDRRPDIVASVTELQLAYWGGRGEQPAEAVIGRLVRAQATVFASRLQKELPQLFEG
ncbi:hypothetical protein [Kineococcus auxinigenes]|uniref:hypothetical protein n=1 Tax=unclassified Kineococcus TaxID=2621656 RepID=UPI003D7C5699